MHMDPVEVFTGKAPAPGGAYAQAQRAGSLIFCSGQIGIDPKTGKLVGGGIEAETRQAMRNLGAILDSAGAGLNRVVKVEAFLTDINDWKAFNAIYSEFFREHKPARTTASVSGLPLNAKVEIACIASLG